LDDHLPPIEIETAANPEFAVIWLHGLGADGSDFVPVVPELGLPAAPAVRFIFPHAPHMPVTCNGGYVMRAWYDIISLDSNARRIDEAGIIASREAIRGLIEFEKAAAFRLTASLSPDSLRVGGGLHDSADPSGKAGGRHCLVYLHSQPGTAD
jgi:predicted esterase